MVRFLNLLREWKHLTLLASLLCLVLAQPVARTGTAGTIVFDVLITIVTAVIFFVVFERRSTRIAALLLAAPMIVVHWIGRIVGPNNAIDLCGRTCNRHDYGALPSPSSCEAFFSHRSFERNDVLGVVCGYLLAGLAWGNLYNLAETVSPTAFSVRSDIAWELESESTRRYLFDNFSFMTLTCYGDAKVVPVAPTASSLTWLEAVFGQFYMAVVVAQLVGLKLSQSLARPSDVDS